LTEKTSGTLHQGIDVQESIKSRIYQVKSLSSDVSKLSKVNKYREVQLTANMRLTHRLSDTAIHL